MESDRGHPTRSVLEGAQGGRDGGDDAHHRRQAMSVNRMPGHLPRSYLYVPGDAADKLAKVLTREADAIIVDLEDAVAPSAKDKARELAATWLASLPQSATERPEVWVRINPGRTGRTDVLAVQHPALTGLCLPKVSAPADIEDLHRLLGEQEVDRAGAPIVLQPLIETARGLLGVVHIATAPRVRQLQLGEFDLGADLGIERGREDLEFLPARLQLVVASVAAGIDPPVGPVAVDFTDLDRFAESTRALKRLGYRSRACIHPAQVAVVNEVFTPTTIEIERARALVASSQHATEEGSGVWQVENGTMIDEAVVRAARRLLGECR